MNTEKNNPNLLIMYPSAMLDSDQYDHVCLLF